MDTPSESQLRAELQLLLCAARVSADSGRIRTLLQERIDWDYLTQTATHHRVLPLLYWNLSQSSPESVPSAVLSELKRDFHSNASLNLKLVSELHAILAFFQSHEIAAIPFKGVSLAFSAYGSLALRTAGDLDILVHKRDVLRAKDLLLSQGFRLLTAVGTDGFPSRGELEFSLARNNPKVRVELRWRLTSRAYSACLDLDRLSDDVQSIELAGKLVPALSPEALLLVLLIHGGKHGWSRLMWICDIAELLRVNPNIDWARLREHAVGLGVWRNVACGLLVVRDTVDAAIPVEILRKIECDEQLPALAAELRENLFSSASAPRTFLGALKADALYWFPLLERPLDKVRYGIQLFVFRPLRLIRDYAAARLKPK